MKLMIASDIHGSAYFCERLLEAFDRETADRMLLLGDILYHGPRNDLPRGYAPKQVLAMLNAVKTCLFCVRGNCDFAVSQWEDAPEEQLLHFEGHTLLLTHGARYGVKSGTGLLETAAAQKGADVVLFGHTHEPYLHSIAAGERVGERTLSRPMTLFNPGSIGYGGSFGHLLLTGETVLFSFGSVFE